MISIFGGLFIEWMEGEVSAIRGKEILTKSLAQPVPSYAMYVFKIPKKTFAEEPLTRLHNFGEVMMLIIRKCIGLPGGKYVFQERNEE